MSLSRLEQRKLYTDFVYIFLAQKLCIQILFTYSTVCISGPETMDVGRASASTVNDLVFMRTFRLFFGTVHGVRVLKAAPGARRLLMAARGMAFIDDSH